MCSYKGNCNHLPDFILPTSDIMKRFFSSAGYALPIDLEMQLFLKVNFTFHFLSGILTFFS